MPELPEVETTRRALAPLLAARTLTGARVHNRALRWPVPAGLGRTVAGRAVQVVERRSKYLLLRCAGGTLIVHLGMTGFLRVVPADEPRRKHDHVELLLDDGRALRFNDSRRFGAILWTADDPLAHPLLAGLGPEPFDAAFDAGYLAGRAAGRVVAVKPFLMDAKTVVGVGNIYASEALHRAGIDPRRAAGRVSRAAFERLVTAVRDVLSEAIAAGGTTIRDFVSSDGEPGYFRISLRVYGRGGEACAGCGAPIKQIRLGQRSTYFCAKCQK
ncbi:MAG: bifunctional DNA-formamidopyrimidine glycosylase/DNA-(apurinic or apyrimidinic site) lyase [Deltaproteobacteria bacterium]|nr:MAG: bifunctional DNA-formamidopyrimidine glycosylase/DNA-(apurinic or apyrimidinic site) lyase [Deltaproteobacteria bacterium]